MTNPIEGLENRPRKEQEVQQQNTKRLALKEER